MKEWLATHLTSASDALWILKIFLSVRRAERESVTYTRYVRLDELSRFVSIGTMEQLTQTCELDNLPLDEMRALRAFRQALV